MKTAIRMNETVKYYGDFAAVKKVSFEVQEGEIFGLLGPNGAGKTTLLRMISGILQPSSGDVYINEYSMQSEAQKAKLNLGFLTGDMSLYERLKPVEVLTYFGNLYGVNKHLLKERINTLMHYFQIHEFADRLCGKLSSGQKQRVAIARAIIHNPPVIVLDEPTTGLDIMSGEFILSFMKTIAKENNKTIIFSTHNLFELERLADRIGIINKGQMVVQGSIAEINQLAGKANLSNSFFSLINN